MAIAPDLSNQLELRIECQDLKNEDTFSKSDPMCVLRIRETTGGPYVEIGRTERVKNDLNPKFTTIFRLVYYFEKRQDLEFAIYDCDSSAGDVDKHDKLGFMHVSLAEVVQGRLQKGRLLESSGNEKAKIFVTARQSVECRESYNLLFAGRGLDNKDFFGKSDPYLVFHKHVEGKFSVTGKTEVVQNNLNPSWKPFLINCATFNDNDDDLPIQIECWDFDDDGDHDLIGHFTTTGRELFSGIGQKSFPVHFSIFVKKSFFFNQASAFKLINEKKKAKKKHYDNSGTILLMNMTKVEDCDFIYYVQNGLQISFIVSIDFTLSNGFQNLHCLNPRNPFNQYTTAIQAVGNVIQEYDSDKLFPVYGFGARFFDSKEASFNYPLNGNFDNPNVVGVQGILDSYRYALSQVVLDSPTNFRPTIDAAMRKASQFQSGLHYFVLLIITDGTITDLFETIDSIVEASYYPLSIIIIGVGNEEFESMEELDSDNCMLKSSYGKVAARDIVQFVALRDVIGQGSDASSQDALAKQVLAEVPRQVKNYLKPKGVFPSTVAKLAAAAAQSTHPN